MVGALAAGRGTAMSKKILLIENDVALAGELARALEARGLATRVTGDGKEGLDLARDERPDAIVLCVELPRMSGYSVCQKLRKDDALKGIPLVLTSAEATEETFEAHRKLKARADDYLVKPFQAGALIEKLGRLVHLPEPPALGEELVTLDDVEELSGEIPLIPAGEQVRASDALPEQDEDLKLLDDAFDNIAGEPPVPAGAPPPGRAPPPLNLADEPPLGNERPMAGDQLRTAADLLPAGDELATHAEIDKLGDEADAALAALGAEEAVPTVDLDRAEALLDEPAAAPRGLSADVPPEPRITPAPFVPAATLEQEAEIQRLQDRISQLLIDLGRAREGAAAESQLRALESDLKTREERLHRTLEEQRAQSERDRAEARREGEARKLAEDRARRAEEAQRRAEEAVRTAEDGQRSAEEAVQKAEADARAVEEALRAAEDGLRAAEEQGRKVAERAGMLEAEVATLRLRAEETEQTASLKAAQLAEALGHHGVLGQKVADLEAELTGKSQAHAGHLETLQAELEAARSALEGHRAEAERRAEELSRRVAELEAVNAKHEERVVKAYQKIKSDEKIREKTRKALAIALQLLDERVGGAPAERPAEPPPRRE